MTVTTPQGARAFGEAPPTPKTLDGLMRYIAKRLSTSQYQALARARRPRRGSVRATS